MAVAVRGAAMTAPLRVMPPLGKAAVPRSGSLAHHENVAAKADEEQIAPAVLAEGRDLAQRPRVGRAFAPAGRERAVDGGGGEGGGHDGFRSEEHTSELPSLMRTSYTVFCLKKKNNKITTT